MGMDILGDLLNQFIVVAVGRLLQQFYPGGAGAFDEVDGFLHEYPWLASKRISVSWPPANQHHFFHIFLPPDPPLSFKIRKPLLA